jgi:two-component system chemotaxis response regulator CheB
MNMNNPCKLMVVDDSKIMRRFMTDLFASDDRIQIVGEAVDGIEALSCMTSLNPDVITLDVNMPRMDGLTILKHLMIRSPKPTVMLSTLTQEGAKTTFDALRYGAVDFIAKPSRLDGGELEAQVDEIIAKVKQAAAVALDSVQYIRVTRQANNITSAKSGRCDRLVVIGAAEGGYGALLKIIPQLRPDAPFAYLTILYAASAHIDAFVRYLNDYSALEVRRAVDGAVVESGVCYFGSGDEYITLTGHNSRLALQVHRAPFASRRGSIDRLMFSVAETLKQQAVGVILSGAGEDGGEGLEEINRMAGVTVIQDPRSCLHKDMALAALARCYPECLLPDAKIAAILNNLR